MVVTQRLRRTCPLCTCGHACTGGAAASGGKDRAHSRCATAGRSIGAVYMPGLQGIVCRWACSLDCVCLGGSRACDRHAAPGVPPHTHAGNQPTVAHAQPPRAFHIGTGTGLSMKRPSLFSRRFHCSRTATVSCATRRAAVVLGGLPRWSCCFVLRVISAAGGRGVRCQGLDDDGALVRRRRQLGRVLTPATSAPGLGWPLPHLHPGLGSRLRHRHRVVTIGKSDLPC